MDMSEDIRLLDIYTMLIELKTEVRDLKEKLPDHEARIRVLERFRFTLVGAILAVSAATSALGTYIGYVVTHH